MMRCKHDGRILNSDECSTITFFWIDNNKLFQYYINTNALAKV